jgi:putative SOS response-associated peptidase YedK
MCGRFSITQPTDAMARLFDATPSNDLPPVPNYNVCPTNDVATVVAGDGVRRLMAMRWGFIPTWYKTPTDGPLLINARAETIAQKPAFAEACRTRRCLIPADGFYEWTKDEGGARLPWYLYRSDKQVMVFAGVWQRWRMGDQDLTTCAIVTTAANDRLSAIHKRQPVILNPDQWALWLGEAGHGAARLMRAGHEDRVDFHRVDVAVNSNRASGPDLTKQINF